MHTTNHPKIRIAAGAGSFVPEQLSMMLVPLETAINDINPELLLHHLRVLVPEYQTDPVHQTTSYHSNGQTKNVPSMARTLANFSSAD